MKKNKWFLKNINVILSGGFFAALALTINFLFWLFPPSKSVPMWLFVLSLIFAWVVWLITYSICNKKKETTYFLPKVRSVNIRDRITIIMDYSEVYSYDSLVSLYYLDEDDETETLLGIGYIETITMKGYFQIRPIEIFDNNIQLNNDSKTKRCLKIKPSVPKNFIGDI